MSANVRWASIQKKINSSASVKDKLKELGLEKFRIPLEGNASVTGAIPNEVLLKYANRLIDCLFNAASAVIPSITRDVFVLDTSNFKNGMIDINFNKVAYTGMDTIMRPSLFKERYGYVDIFKIFTFGYAKMPRTKQVWGYWETHGNEFVGSYIAGREAKSFLADAVNAFNSEVASEGLYNLMAVLSDEYKL